MNFKDNPNYTKQITSGGKDYYTLNQSGEYHVSRYIAGNAQNIFSASGATKELTSAILEQMKDVLNSDKPNNRKVTDCGVLIANLEYRMKYPIDEECAIRMGAIYTFVDGEDPNKTDDDYTKMKMKAAREDANLYAFFLEWGLINTPAYKELLNITIDMDYFQKRMQQIEAYSLSPSLKK